LPDSVSFSSDGSIYVSINTGSSFSSPPTYRGNFAALVQRSDISWDAGAYATISICIAAIDHFFKYNSNFLPLTWDCYWSSCAHIYQHKCWWQCGPHSQMWTYSLRT
jgi:hypothetical protein